MLDLAELACLKDQLSHQGTLQDQPCIFIFGQNYTTFLSHSPLTVLSNNSFPHNLLQRVTYFFGQTNKFVVAWIIFPRFLMSVDNTFAIPQSQHQLDKCIKHPAGGIPLYTARFFNFFLECRLSATCILSSLNSSVVLPPQVCQFSLYTFTLIRHLGFNFTLQIIVFN